MEFLSPLFWIGALAVSIPVLLHLVRREESRSTVFASLMFLRRIPQKDRRRQRIRYWFLLLLRCLGLLLLIAAFSRPVATGDWVSHVNPLVGRSTVILIDRSLSMSAGSRWSRALQAASTKIESLGEGDEAMIVQFGLNGEVLSPWESDRRRLKAVLDAQVRPSFEATSYLEGLRLAAEQFRQARNPDKEIYLITDLQRSGINAQPGWRVPAEIGLEIKDVGDESSNLYVENMGLERTIFSDTYPHAVAVRVKASGRNETAGRALLYLEDQLQSSQSFQLDPAGTASLQFKPFQVKEGTTRGRVVIQPGDALAADNTFYFVVERGTPGKVLLLSPEGKSAFYLEKALSSGSNLPFEIEPRASLGSLRLEPATIPVLILDDTPRPPAVQTLKNYVERGGGIVVALGSRARPQAYAGAWQTLMGAKLVERSFVKSDDRPFVSITDVHWEHPIFSVFQDAYRSGIVSGQFYGYWRLQPLDGTRVLARFSSGDPALLERDLGSGRILVFPSSLDPVWNDFPLRSVYLPFWYQAVHYASRALARSAFSRVSQVLAPEQWGRLSPQQDSDASGWDLLDPQGKHVLGLDQKRPQVIPLLRPGFYEVRRQKQSDWVAVDPPASESDLSRLEPDEVQAVFGHPDRQAPGSTRAAAIQSQEKRQSLWWIFLVGAAVIFALEPLIADRTFRKARLAAATGLGKSP